MKRFQALFIILLLVCWLIGSTHVAYSADEVGYATASLVIDAVPGIANKAVFEFVASTTDATIPSVTWTIPIQGFVMQAASIPDAASRISASCSIQIVDDTGRDIFGGILGDLDHDRKQIFAPVSVSGTTEPVFVDTTLSSIPSVNYATSASHRIEIYWTPYLFR